VGVDQVVALPANDPRQLPNRPKIEPVSHRHLVQLCLPGLSQARKPARLDAGEGDLEAVLAQRPGQQILHPFGPRVVFAVDHVQDPDFGGSSVWLDGVAGK